MFRRFCLRIQTLLAVLVLILASLPPHSVDAQTDELTPDEIVLLDRALDAAALLDAYTSYEATIVHHMEQTWTGTLGGIIVAGQSMNFDIEQHDRATLTADGPNVSQTIKVSERFQELDGPEQSFDLSSELRALFGRVFARAQYTHLEAYQAGALPAGWIEITDETVFDAWPGFASLAQASNYTELNSPSNWVRLFGAPLHQVEAVLRATATGVTSEQTTIADGTRVEAITIAFDRRGASTFELLGSADDPITQIILDAASGDLLTLTLFIDGAGRPIGTSQSLKLDEAAIDIGVLPDVPEGFLLDVHAAITDSMTITSIDADLPLAQIPDAAPALAAYSAPEEIVTLPWWNDRVFYEVFVRSFYDSDGDGIGDLRGLIERLDYLNDGDPGTTDDLGITGLWLMPVTESPSYHGYDTTDYYIIESDYGTNQDFLDLMQAAHARGMVVIVDLMLNHTSSEHPWFLAAQQGGPAYEDWYIWRDVAPNWLSPWGSQVWHPVGDRYYYGLFWSGMPDLNYENPAVTTQMSDVTRYWLEDMGADGFRLDAIRHLIEVGSNVQNTPPTLRWLEYFDTFVHTINPNALTVGEIWDDTAAVVPYVGDRVDIAFEFDLAGAMLHAAQTGRNTALVVVLNDVLTQYPSGQYATFLTNHDQDRVMSQLVEDEAAARVAATLLLTSPGVPFVYYGEEIGMVGTKPDERIRTPMQWDDSTGTAGFSRLLPWQRVQRNYRDHNVAAMTSDPNSLLSHYRTLIRLRAAHPALRSGTMQLVETSDNRLFATLRYSEEETILVLVNLSREPVSDYTFTVNESLLGVISQAQIVFGNGAISTPNITDSGGFIDYRPIPEIAPQSSMIIVLD